MARTKGIKKVNYNFESKVDEPLDARHSVETFSDLFQPATWDGVALYNGMMVNVVNGSIVGDNGSYRLVDAENYQDIYSWELVYKEYSVQDTLSLYIDNISGDDINGDGSETNPFKTLKRAFISLPKEAKKDVKIYLSGGTYQLAIRDFFPLELCQIYRVKIYGHVTKVLDIEEVGFVSGINYKREYTVSGANPGWTQDQYQGYFVGKGNTAYNGIIHNDQNTLTFLEDPWFSGFSSILSADTSIEISDTNLFSVLPSVISGFRIELINVNIKLLTKLIARATNSNKIRIISSIIDAGSNVIELNNTAIMVKTFMYGEFSNTPAIKFTSPGGVYKISILNKTPENSSSYGLDTTGSFDGRVWSYYVEGFYYGIGSLAAPFSPLFRGSVAFVNCGVAISSLLSPKLYVYAEEAPLQLENVEVFFHADYDHDLLAVLPNKIVGTPNVNWVNVESGHSWNGRSLPVMSIKKYIDLEKSVLLRFPGTGTYIDGDEETSDRTIYVSTTGNDESGDGSDTSPFATIKRALQDIKPVINDCTVKIKLGAGEFHFDKESMRLLNNIEFVSTENRQSAFKLGVGACLYIEGNDFSIIDDGYTISNIEDYKYTITKSGKTFSENEFIGKWFTDNTSNLTKASNIFLSNDAGSDTVNSIIPESGKNHTGVSILDVSTTLVFDQDVSSFGNGLKGIGLVYFSLFNIKTTHTEGLSLDTNGVAIAIYYSRLSSIQSGLKRILNLNSTPENGVRFLRCYFDGEGYTSNVFSLLTGWVNMKQCLITANVDPASHLTAIDIGDGVEMRLQECGIREVQKLTYGFASWYGNYTINIYGLIYADNVGSLFELNDNVKIMSFHPFKMYLKDVSHLFLNNSSYKDSSGKNSGVTVVLNDKIDVLNGSFSVFANDDKRFIAPDSARFISIDGIFSELETGVGIENVSVNTQTTYQIGDTTQNKSIKLDYQLTRGSSVRFGTCNIVNVDDTSVLFDDSYTENVDVGVTLSARIDSNEINLVLDVDNSTTDTVDLKYNASRIMKDI